MRTVRPSEHKLIRVVQTVYMEINGAERMGGTTNVVDFPVHRLNPSEKDAWKNATFKVLLDYTNEWFEKVFLNIVPEG